MSLANSGMAPIIRAVLTNLISEEEASSIDIIANDVEFTDAQKEGKTWEIVYRHPERSVPASLIGRTIV
jgi:2-hydroxy-3-keto-5-methylthiopentenyl-1-phosphate phosphatase